MKRRNTIDSLHVNWPIVRYYYTHNNGSCDDILIQHKSFGTPRQIHHNRPNYNNRRRTFPMEKSVPKEGLLYHHHHHHHHQQQQQQQQQDRRHSHKIEIMTPPPVIRRGSSYRNQQQQRHKRKRETLANIISNLSRSNSSTLTSGNISSIYNGDISHVDSDLDIKWETIRQYHPQLDNEKILEQDSQGEDEGYSYDLTYQEQRNDVAVVDMNDSSNKSSSDDSNGLFLPAEQEAEENGTGSSDAMSIQIDAATNNHTMAATTAVAPKTELPTATTLVPMSNTVDHTDMFLFLFGFICFPLWWIGTWRFFMQSDKTFLHKQQRSFQIVNCYMALASLLLTGLIIGLVTVWA